MTFNFSGGPYHGQVVTYKHGFDGKTLPFTAKGQTGYYERHRYSCLLWVAA